MKRPAVFFDRDNTLIANDGYLGDPAGVVLIEGAADAIARVRDMGFAVVTFSNQSGVARGLFTEEAVHAVNARLDELLQDQNRRAVIGRHEFCPFHPEATVERYRQDSELRKPKPGMIFQAAQRLDLDLARSWVIGDAPRDIEAGKAAGCVTILFADPSLKASPAAAEASSATPDFSADSLKRAVDLIARETLGIPLPEELLKPATEPASEPASEPGIASSPATEAPATPETAPAPAIDASQEPTPAPVPIHSAADEPVAAPIAPAQLPAVEAVSAPEPAEAKPAPAIRKPRKPTFADRVKNGTFTPVSKRPLIKPIAEVVVAAEPAEPPIAVSAADAPSEEAAEARTAAPAGTPADEPLAPPAEAPAITRARAVPRSTVPATEETGKKMTFAQRVKSGAFQAERAPDGDGAVAAEKPNRALGTTGERPAAQVSRVVESLTSTPPRPTDPVPPAEDLGPILQAILEEVRLMREEPPPADFSITKLLAGIVQVLVLPALFMAWMHHDVAADAQLPLLTAIFLQTLVIALSVMGRQS